MADILETDALAVTSSLLADVEATTGILMPGDERRILIDGAGYALAQQNVSAQLAWDQLDPDIAQGDVLTARGAAVGISRRAGSPCTVWVQLRKTDGDPLTITAGTLLTIAGVQLAIDTDVSSSGAVGSFIEASATATITHPVASQAAAQNALYPYTAPSGDLDTASPRIDLVRISHRGDPYVAWAVADDEDDDALFRARIKDAMRRPGDYSAITREMLPDAKAVRVSNASPGEVVVTAIRGDADGYASSYPAGTVTLLQTFLRADHRRLLGDLIITDVGHQLRGKPSLKVWCDRGYSSSVAAQIASALPEWCRGFASFGGVYDLGDLIAFLDAQDHVRYCDVLGDSSTLDGVAIVLIGSPGHYLLGDGDYLRMSPADITLTYGELA